MNEEETNTPMTLNIECSGWFQATMRGDPSFKCDLALINQYHYLVIIEATDERLSPEGFIIEASRVQSYFDQTYAVGETGPVMSCELIARKTARDLCALLKRENVSVTKVNASIKGAHGAHITAICGA